jgi:GDP-L-fucose synthase
MVQKLSISSRIYVAGHHGLIGSALLRRLHADGYSDVVVRSHAQLELADALAVEHFFAEQRPSFVLLAAGRVGGIVQNRDCPADFIFENLTIQLNILRSAARYGVERLIFFGSSCMYPRECMQPMPESALLTGVPESTSMAYAMAKLAGMQMCLALNQQMGKKRFIPVIPNSAFGPNDNFDPKSGHVLSALLHRFYEAVKTRAPEVMLWGSGQPRREFVHADEIADACMCLLTEDISSLDLPVNLGSGHDYSIRELAETIAKVAGYTGDLRWDSTKPDGAPRKLLDSSRLATWGWQSRSNFENQLRETYDWYIQNADPVIARRQTP